MIKLEDILPGLFGETIGSKQKIDFSGSPQVLLPDYLGKSVRGATIVIAASNAKDTIDADYVCTGTADNVIINAAIQSIAATGGKVVLSQGDFYVTAPINMNFYNLWVEGQGAATTIHQANNANVTSIISISGTNVAQMKLSNVHIEGNKNNNSFGNGITMQTPGASNSWVMLEDVVVFNCPNNGVAWNANSGSSSYYITNVHSSGNNGNGFFMQFSSGVALTDSVFINCISDTNALNGFYLATLDTHFYGCKAYFNGSAGGSVHGFYIAGYNNYFSGCQAQDNYGCGFFLNNDGDGTYGTQNNVFINCDADSNYNPSNSRGATIANSPMGDGWYINNTSGTTLIGCQSYVRPYPFAWGQNIGFHILGTSSNTSISMPTGSGNTSALITNTSSGSLQIMNNTVSVLTPGTTVSVDPTLGDTFTLTPAQAETINAASVVYGQLLKLVITTSGTSSFVLTFGTHFKTTGTLATGTSSGKVFVITFVSDGTNYNEISRTTAM